MKHIAFVAIAALSFSLLGCRPDHALQRGEVIDARPSTSIKDVKQQGQPQVIEPQTDKESPVKQVQ